MAKNRLPLSPVHKLLITQVLVVVILLLSAAVYQGLYENREQAQQAEIVAPVLNVDVFEVQSARFQEIIYGFGTAQADREVIVAAQVSGVVIEVDPSLNVGSVVTSRQLVPLGSKGTVEEAGDLLIRIDPEDYLQRQRQSLSRIEEANTELQRMDVVLNSTKRQLKQSQDVLQTLKAEYGRVQSAMRKNASSESELSRSLLEVQRYQETILQLQNQLDAMPAERRAAEQRLASSEAEAKQVANDLKRTQVLPPFDGVVSEVSVELGQFVRGGEPLFRLTDLQVVEIAVALPQEEFLRLQELQKNGTKPTVQLRAGDESSVTWAGDLVRVSPEADAGSRTVKVFIEVLNTEASSVLLPGTFVTAAIDGPVSAGALLIPREAIVSDAVYVVTADSTVVQRSVVVKRTLQAMAVVEGLQVGEQIVMSNLDLLTPDRKVNVQQRLSLQGEIGRLQKSRIRLLPQLEK
ncbi:MAG: efflux RND transporter periplasmic adaptor subunit [Fuerstiella sp.]